MSLEYRLVAHTDKRHWGSQGLELRESWFYLQRRVNVYPDPPTPWETLPVVMYSDLPPNEQAELREITSQARMG